MRTPDPAAERIARARERLVAARSRQDAAGAVDAIADALAELFRQYGPVAAVDEWIDALDGTLASGYPVLPSGTESRIIHAALAILGRRPSHPALPLLASRAERLLAEPETPAAEAAGAAGFLFEFAIRGGNFQLADRVVARIDPVATSAAEIPSRIDWLEARALHAWLLADHACAFDAVDRALALAAEASLPEPYAAHEQGASAALSAGNGDRAARHLASMRRLLNQKREQDVAHLAFLESADATLRGELELARKLVEGTVAADDDAVPPYFTTLWRLGRAHVAIASGRLHLAERELTGVLARAGSMFWRYLEYSALLHRAWLRLRQGRTQPAAGDVRRAMSRARELGYRNMDPWWNPSLATDLSECPGLFETPLQAATWRDRKPLG